MDKIYHMVNEGYCSWYEFDKAIFEIVGWDVELKSIKSSELIRLARKQGYIREMSLFSKR